MPSHGFSYTSKRAYVCKKIQLKSREDFLLTRNDTVGSGFFNQIWFWCVFLEISQNCFAHFQKIPAGSYHYFSLYAAINSIKITPIRRKLLVLSSFWIRCPVILRCKQILVQCVQKRKAYQQIDRNPFTTLYVCRNDRAHGTRFQLQNPTSKIHIDKLHGTTLTA